MGTNQKPWLNNSGCPDPTAYEALKRIQAEEKHKSKDADADARLLINVLKDVVDLTGFELIGRIQIKHKKSGKIYK